MRYAAWLVVLTTVAGASPADPPAPAAGVADLIDQLASRRFRDREAAERELDRVGEPALAALWRAARGADDPEARRRAAAAAARIERRAEAARLLTPTTVHLACVDTPLADAVADLARQSGQAVALDPNARAAAGRRITLDTGKVSFWEALDRLCQAGGLTDVMPLSRSSRAASVRPLVMGNGLQGQIVVNGRALEDIKPAAAGLILNAADAPPPAGSKGRSVSVRAVPLASAPAGEIHLAFTARPEPRFALRGLRSVEIDAAEDDRGRELAARGEVVPAAAAEQQLRVLNGRQVLIIQEDGRAVTPAAGRTVRLDRPDGAAAVKAVRGRALVELLTPTETLAEVADVTGPDADDPAEGKAGVALRVISCRPAGDEGQYAVEAEFRYSTFAVEPAAPPATAARNLMIVRGLELSSADGTAWQMHSMSPGRHRIIEGQTEVRATVTWRPEKAGSTPETLRFVGRRAVTLEVPFELAGLNLP